jgi:Domain of unknown function (DUF4337)
MEEIEVPTEHLNEAIEEGAEEKKEKWTLYLALSTAFMAVFAAIAGLLAGHHANEALIERVKSSDQWSFYQSKSLKSEIAANTDKILHALSAGHPEASGRPSAANQGAPIPGDNSKDVARYEEEKKEIKKKADEAEKASEWHLGKHVPLASAVTAFQVAIAISAIAILTRRKKLWYGGLFLALIGIYFFVQGILP